jgi:NAD(P)H dehydrogenase (quinone)
MTSILGNYAAFKAAGSIDQNYGNPVRTATARPYTPLVRATIVLCHPLERSFCRAVADALRKGIDADACSPGGGAPVTFHDLYAELPDPILTGAEIARRFSMDEQIQRYSAEVVQTDHLWFVHPDWWSGPPALLKGWIERVFRPGIAYDWRGEEFTEKRHVPLLTGKELSLFVTTDRDEGDPPLPIEGFWRDVASYSGMQLTRFTLYPDLRRSGHRRRRMWLQEAREFAQGCLTHG